MLSSRRAVKEVFPALNASDSLAEFRNRDGLKQDVH
jgi:hypothetical protein